MTDATVDSGIAALTRLVTDPHFLRIDRLRNRANIFGIVGRTYTETWHSMILAWLLDPRGSHGMEDHAFRLLASTVAHHGRSNNRQLWYRLAALADLKHAVVSPNERSQGEKVYADGKRADVDIDDVRLMITKEKTISYKVVVEEKIRDWPTPQQLDGYATIATIPGREFVGILLAPADRIASIEPYLDASDIWSAIDFQVFHDGVLAPMLEHPELDDRSRLLLGDYIDCLRTWNKGVPTVVTDSEKELALAIYEKHKEAIRLIAKVLRAEGKEDADTPEADEDEDIDLSFHVNGTEISGATGRELMANFMAYLDKGGILKKAAESGAFPVQNGPKRFIVNKEPIHPGGKKFLTPVKAGGWYAEAHASRAQILARTLKLAKHLGLSTD